MNNCIWKGKKAEDFFFVVYQNRQFLLGKSKFHARKKLGNVTLPPLENFSVMRLLSKSQSSARTCVGYPKGHLQEPVWVIPKGICKNLSQVLKLKLTCDTSEFLRTSSHRTRCITQIFFGRDMPPRFSKVGSLEQIFWLETRVLGMDFC